jgi:hypothetical protein
VPIPGEPTRWRLTIAAPSEALDAIERSIETIPTIKADGERQSSVSVTCLGAFASDLTARVAALLADCGVHPRKLLFAAMTITAIVKADERVETERTLHKLTVLP